MKRGEVTKGEGTHRHHTYVCEMGDERGLYAMHVGHKTWQQLGVLHASASGPASVMCKVSRMICTPGEVNTMR